MATVQRKTDKDGTGSNRRDWKEETSENGADALVGGERTQQTSPSGGFT